SEMRGRIGVAFDIGESARTVQAVGEAGGPRGGPTTQPLDLRLTAAVDDRATTASLTAATKGSGLVELTARLPISLPELISQRGAPETLQNTTLAGTAQ